MQGRIERWAEGARVNLIDLLFLVALFVAGLCYHWDSRHWRSCYVGDSPYSDAQFWWDDAIQLSEGIWADNPGRGYHPGFILLAGATLPVVGPKYETFHKFLLVNFLAVALLFYLALRQPLGRLGAACAAGLLVLNPYTAEWLSTPTTEGMGLLLHVLALACLLLGARRLRLPWLGAFGVAFALGTLTRPIVTPFLGVAVLLLLLLPRRPVRRRLGAAGCVLVAFFLPVFLWLAYQRVTVGEWSLSTNDASAFYAASDPNIQTWTPDMYVSATEAAKRRHGVPAVTQAQLNEAFWRLTRHNYRTHFKYHCRRFLPHLWQVANFSPTPALPGALFWKDALLSGLAAGLGLWLFGRLCPWRGLLLLSAAAGPWLSSDYLGFMTCGGALLALLPDRRRPGDLGLVFLAWYWLAGVGCLFLTGGTWGPPVTPAFGVNDLGDRIGSQVFFAGDLLAAAFLVRLAILNRGVADVAEASAGFPCGALGRLLARPRPAFGLVAVTALGLAATATVAVLGTGAGVATARGRDRARTPATPYPDVASVVRAYQGLPSLLPHPLRVAPDWLGLVVALGGAAYATGPGSDDVLFTGAASSFIWNMPGQKRSQALMHPQPLAAPYTMGAKWVIVDFPRHLRTEDWSRRQGAFIVRRVPDSQNNRTNLPYYLTGPAVRAFVPLTADKSGYDLGQAVWFPLVKYASQLDAAGELRCGPGAIQWCFDSGKAPFQRRLLLRPAGTAAAPGRVTLTVDLAHAAGARRLSFGYQWLFEAGQAGGPLGVHVSVNRTGTWWPEERLGRRVPVTEAVAAEHPFPVELDLSDPSLASVELTFDGLPPGASVWIYELNLEADDFRS
jgi:4-amino-4-deoxy-L-arabinose transferase-like glycosyltransferase